MLRRNKRGQTTPCIASAPSPTPPPPCAPRRTGERTSAHEIGPQIFRPFIAPPNERTSEGGGGRGKGVVAVTHLARSSSHPHARTAASFFPWLLGELCDRNCRASLSASRWRCRGGSLFMSRVGTKGQKGTDHFLRFYSNRSNGETARFFCQGSKHGAKME